jgi:polar amino acid transport system permease protein
LRKAAGRWPLSRKAGGSWPLSQKAGGRWPLSQKPAGRRPLSHKAAGKHFGWLDAVVLVVLAGFIGFVTYRVQTVLNYHWAWGSIPNYILRWDSERGWVANLLLQGLATTLRLSFWSLLLACVFGVLIATGRIARNLLPRLMSGTYVELMRNTPPLVLIFIGYFFVSSQIMPLLGIDAFVRAASPEVLQVISVAFGEPRLLKNFISATIVLALFEGAYVAEILRGGIQSVEVGQWDAAAALGLTRWQSLRRVILPQAVARMVPPLGGQTISLIKDSSVISLISIQDLTFMANDVAVSTTRVFETWITASAMYFAVCYMLSIGFRKLERRLAR